MNENTPTDLQPGDYRVEGHGAVVRVTSHNTFGSTLDGYVPAQEAPQQVRHLEADRQHVQDQAQLRQEGKQPWEQAK